MGAGPGPRSAGLGEECGWRFGEEEPAADCEEGSGGECVEMDQHAAADLAGSDVQEFDWVYWCRSCVEALVVISARDEILTYTSSDQVS